MWGPGTAFEQGPKEFQSKVGKKGDGAMEMVSMDMKAKGMFLARSLSYEGAEYSIQPLTFVVHFMLTVASDTLTHKISDFQTNFAQSTITAVSFSPQS